MNRISDTEQRFADALRAYEAAPEPNAKRMALGNCLVWGRAITNVIQNARSVWSGFEEWYARHAQVLKDDQRFRAFYQMRTEVLKRGHTAARAAALVWDEKNELFDALLPIPEGAVSAVLFDPETRFFGWIVRRDDAKEERVERKLPESVKIDEFLVFSSDGVSPGTWNVDKALQAYADLLRSMAGEMLGILRGI
jgi:hypothetical protein